MSAKLNCMFAVVASVLLFGCAERNDACRELASTFFAQHDRRDTRAFSALDVDAQYEIYICGQQYMHPPHLELATALALEGESAARFLHARLEQTRDPYTIEDIVWVLAEMHRTGAYAVSRDQDLLQLAQERTATITNLQQRAIVSGWIQEIRTTTHGTRPPPP